MADIEDYYSIYSLSTLLKSYFQQVEEKKRRSASIQVPGHHNSDIDFFKSLKAELYHKLSIPVDGIDGDSVDIHNAVATGPKKWYGQKRSDWVWYVPDEGENQFGDMQDRIPAKVIAFLRIKWQGTSYRLALLNRCMLYDKGKMNKIHGLPTVIFGQKDRLEINDVQSVMGRAHLVQDELDKTRWIVNTRSDLVIFNIVY